MSERGRVHGKRAAARSNETREERRRRVVREGRKQRREDRAVRRVLSQVYAHA